METSTWLALAPTAASSAVYMTMMGGFAAAMRRERRRGPPALARAPRVSILKPLAGADDDLDANLASFAALDYPEFEVLFGVASMDDPAYAIARRFVARHANVTARVVVTEPDAAVNPKVAQLIGLERRATGEVIVISDSNVRVAPGYLWSLVRELEQPGVGLATSVFAGTGERSLGAALENLQIGAMVAPGIAALALLSKRPFTVGKSMAMRRRDLITLGGFPVVGHVLAEDHMLGRLFLDAGFGVRTSLQPIENRNVDCGVKRCIERHTRWAKMRRALAPTAFALEPLLVPLIVAVAMAVAVPCRATWAAVLACAAMQTACAWLAMRTLRGSALPWYYAPLEVFRSFAIFACWASACVSRRIVWRGHPFVLGRGSVITPAPERRLARILRALT